jgi:hypothetical protein
MEEESLSAVEERVKTGMEADKPWPKARMDPAKPRMEAAHARMESAHARMESAKPGAKAHASLEASGRGWAC